MATTHPAAVEDNESVSAKEVEVLIASSGAAQALYRPSDDEERALDRKVNRKLDRIVLATLAIQFTSKLCGIDKTNVGFVATSSFPQDAILGPDDIPNSLSLVKAPFKPSHFPLLTRHSSRPPMSHSSPSWSSSPAASASTASSASQVAIWGALCMAHAAIKCTNFLFALRLLIGAAEAGYVQLGMYYMSTMYPKTMFGKRAGFFTGMYSIAGAFAGSLMYGLLQTGNERLSGWQIVFLLEGGLTVLIGVASVFHFPRDLATAWFLTPAERQHAMRRMAADLAGAQEREDLENTNKVTKRDVMDVLKDTRKLLTVLCNVASVLPVAALTSFLPLLVEGMGHEGIMASVMSASPFVVGVLGLVCFVTSSDHFRERSLHTVAVMGLGITGLIVMAASSNNIVRYVFVHVCLAGVFAGGPLIAVWLAGNTPWHGARSVVLGINGWSSVAGVVAGQLFKSRFRPRYQIPLMVMVGIMVAGMIMLVLLNLAYRIENRKRAKIIAGWTQEQFEEEARSEERRGDQRRTFVYGY